MRGQILHDEIEVVLCPLRAAGNHVIHHVRPPRCGIALLDYDRHAVTMPADPRELRLPFAFRQVRNGLRTSGGSQQQTAHEPGKSTKPGATHEVRSISNAVVTSSQSIYAPGVRCQRCGTL